MKLVPSLDNMCGEGRRPKLENMTVQPRKDTWFVREPKKSLDLKRMNEKGKEAPVRVLERQRSEENRPKKSKKEVLKKPSEVNKSDQQTKTENTSIESSEDKLNEIITMLESDDIDEDKLPNINILDIDDMTEFDNATSIDVFDKNNPFEQNQDVDTDLDKYMVDLGPDEDRLDEDDQD